MVNAGSGEATIGNGNRQSPCLLAAAGEGTVDCNTLFGFWAAREADISIQKLIGLMDKNDIAKALSLSARGILFDYIAGNDETVEASRKYEQIVPVATLDPPCTWRHSWGQRMKG